MFSIRRIFNRYLSNITKNTLDWATSDTNGLVKQLSARIKAGGPITVADFMRESLLNPNYVCVICSRISFLTYIRNMTKNKNSDYYHYSFRVITHGMKYSAKKEISLRHPRSVRYSVKYDVYAH